MTGVLGGWPPRRGDSRKRRRRLERGGDFPHLYYLCSEEEQREENVYTAEQHNDVAEEVHELNFLEVVEDNSNEVEHCAEDEHAEALC